MFRSTIFPRPSCRILRFNVPCYTIDMTPENERLQGKALERLRKALSSGTATVVINRQGAVAFKGWEAEGLLFDLCAYRKLKASNSPELRRAVMRAEALAGRKVDDRAVNSGVHSHDGGQTWGTH